MGRYNRHFLNSDESDYSRRANGVMNAFSGSPGVQIRRFKFTLRVCGPKMAICGCLLSAWGLLQLVIMGLAFQSHSIALVEDLDIGQPSKFTQKDLDVLQESVEGKLNLTDGYFLKMDRAYAKSAYNCYVAALLYLLTLLISLHQHWLNGRVTPTGYERYA